MALDAIVKAENEVKHQDGRGLIEIQHEQIIQAAHGHTIEDDMRCNNDQELVHAISMLVGVILMRGVDGFEKIDLDEFYGQASEMGPDSWNREAKIRICKKPTERLYAIIGAWCARQIDILKIQNNEK